ncbi:uncharacterized protein LACBIDRAFT_315516 [Laccaria bicolor S238N-H82]|uniref:Predicted protein n=1 Tax=Laccaria bicolor (strain S238N-H82 / ATCC MYA-4686) TaxID=486041 RepID=B0D2K0_LACBS|nr:uncharacterized protein LACBIDRAFT_315516 [Laccaria bicolor S238N-H82]EDR10765.1 predicted protein [Laccaria bicolor S238N-H82]|eukprot:XP_001878066.1 predicted protein [Laccaria bicolor S238N-H82]
MFPQHQVQCGDSRTNSFHLTSPMSMADDNNLASAALPCSYFAFLDPRRRTILWPQLRDTSHGQPLSLCATLRLGRPLNFQNHGRLASRFGSQRRGD